MSLIKCPECGKEISDKSTTCINCGFPIGENLEKTDLAVNEPFPDLPSNLNIGAQIFDLSGGTEANVRYSSDKKFMNLKNTNYDILLHHNGISISELSKIVFTIHKSQIVNIFQYQDTITTDGDVVGSAIAGGLLFGPVGAVVGGMAGTKKKEVYGNILCIEFWDVNSKSKVILSFFSDKKVSAFISRCQSQLGLNNNTIKKEFQEKIESSNDSDIGEQGNGCLIAGIVIVTIILIIIFLGGS